MGKLHIDVLGTSFTIQAAQSEEYLQKLLGYYKRIVDDVQKSSGIKDNLQLSILSGIMLCDELYTEKQNKVAIENGINPEQLQFSRDSEEIAQKTQEMIDKINKVL